MNRRELLKAMAAAGVLPVSQVIEVTSRTKAIIFGMQPGTEGDVQECRRGIKRQLIEAGCPGVGVVVIEGLEIQGVVQE